MNENFTIKENYTKEETLNYCNLRKNYLLESCNKINRTIIDELFCLEKIITFNTQKYFNVFAVDVYSAVKLANNICGSKKLEEHFNKSSYEKQYRSILKYLVTRFNISSLNNFYELEYIDSDFFNIEDDNKNIFNVRRSFPSKKNEINEDTNFIHKLFGISKDDYNIDSLNKNIFRLSDYYNKYVNTYSLKTFCDTFFSPFFDNYTDKYRNFNFNYNNIIKLSINKLPLNLYDQDNIMLLFETPKEKIVINDIYFYHSFTYKIFGKENIDDFYMEINTSNCSKLNYFLLIANTKRGVTIYETSNGIKNYNNVIVDNEKDIKLLENTIYLKSKLDFISINLNDTFNQQYYSQYLINNKISFINRLPLGIINENNYESFKIIKGKKYYIFYIADDKSQKGNVLKHIIDNLELVEIEENVFSDDSSINYKIYIEQNNIEMLVLLEYLKRELPPFKIYNISVMDIYHFILKDKYFYENILPRYQKSIKKHEKAENNFYSKMDHVCNLIFNEIMNNKKLSFEQAANLLNDNYINRELILEKTLNDLFTKLRNEKNEEYLQLRAKEEYDKSPLYYDKYVRQLDFKKRNQWKSERKLYDVIHNIFPDAIYQYRSNWLERQSLDIFIPSINTAIEYQGIQHYKQVDYFGNQDEFEQRIQNDIKKKELCKNNNVNLIEWLYNDPISDILVKERFNLLMQNINFETKNINEINKNNSKEKIINEAKNIIIEMDKIINTIKTIKNDNKNIISYLTNSSIETSLSNYEFELSIEKQIYEKLETYDNNMLSNYINNLNYRLGELQETFIRFENNINNDKKEFEQTQVIAKPIDKLNKNSSRENLKTKKNINHKGSIKITKELLKNQRIKALKKLLKNVKSKKDKEMVRKAITRRVIKTILKVLLYTIGIILIIPLMIIYFILTLCFSSKPSKKKSGDLSLLSLLLMNYSNKKRNNSRLENWQDDLVKSGKYDSWNFEEEELEDDDYYNDDLDYL